MELRMKKHLIEENAVLEIQKALLEEKLSIHLDFWSVDKWLLEKDLAEAKRTQASEEAHRAQQAAQMDLSYGLLQQENLILKLKLETSLDDLKLLQEEIDIRQLLEEKVPPRKIREKKEAPIIQQCDGDQRMICKNGAKILDEVAIQQEKYTAQMKSLQESHEVELAQARQNTDTLKHQLHELENSYREQLVSESQKLQKLEQELVELQENQAKIVEKEKQVRELEQQVHKLQEKHQRELHKQRGETEKLSSQRKKEVMALVREKQFVWDQLRRIEEDYLSRLKTKDDQLQSASVEARSATEEMQRINSQRALELTILRMEKERAQEEVHLLKEAMMEKGGNGKVYQELKRTAHQGEEWSNSFAEHFVCSASNTKNEIAHQITITRRPSSQKNQLIEECALGDESSLIPCGSSIGDNEVCKELKEIRRQFEEVVSLLNAKGEELKKTSKNLQDLRLENDNLRTLYTDLEAKYIENKKSDKLRVNANRDTATRNLKVELDAAASDVHEDANWESESRVTRSMFASKRTKNLEKCSSEKGAVEGQSQNKGKRDSSKFGPENINNPKRACSSRSGQSTGSKYKQKTPKFILNHPSIPVKAFFSSSFNIPKVKHTEHPP